MTKLPTHYDDEPSRLTWLAAHFPEFQQPEEPVLTALTLLPVGEAAADDRLQALSPVAYAEDRNFLSGSVSRLSFDLRHGVTTLRTAGRQALQHAQALGAREAAAKYLQELGWRDFFQRVLDSNGQAIWQNLEPYKTGLTDEDFTKELPDDIRFGKTALACIDAFQTELVQTGYLHNHARMYFAAYLIHWRRVHWSVGARFFLRHLIDADLGSNNASWQWVASTFSAKPYIFNRENLGHFAGEDHCASCVRRRSCPFDAPYEQLAEKLFPEVPSMTR